MDPTEDVMDIETKLSVAKKLYYGGFLFLPWLWLANFLLFWGDLHKRRVPEELKMYTRRSLLFFCIGTVLFIAWIIIYQVNWKNWGILGESISIVLPRGA